MLKRSIAILSLFFLALQVQATHIVGGELRYTCLGDDLYEVSLTVFRDCYNGSPNAWFDTFLIVGVEIL